MMAASFGPELHLGLVEGYRLLSNPLVRRFVGARRGARICSDRVGEDFGDLVDQVAAR